MARPSFFSVEDKYRLVLAVTSGEMSIAEAARRGRASEQSTSNWKRLFLESAKLGLAESRKPGPNARERQPLEEVEELKAALGEAHVELRVWQKSAEHRLAYEDFEVIRLEERMPTSRFVRLHGVPERSYRRHLAFYPCPNISHILQ